jgi:hypothetical protein
MTKEQIQIIRQIADTIDEHEDDISTEQLLARVCDVTELPMHVVVDALKRADNP